MMRFLYTLFVHLFQAGALIAGLFHNNARLWYRGRTIQKGSMKKFQAGNRPVVWFHCASLGEFEQGRPVIGEFRLQNPGYDILLTFFSPSGYEVRKTYSGADHVLYLPADTPSNARCFIETWNPVMAVFIKYDFWYNYLHALWKRGVPCVFVSALFHPGQVFFRPYGFWFRQHLQKVSHFFVQDNPSADILRGIGIHQVTVSGDTRFDRVRTIARVNREIPQLHSFSGQNMVLIAGSTWEADEKKLLEARRLITHPMKMIIAPHQVDETGIQRLVRLLGGKAIRFSEVAEEVPADTDILIIDSIGMLSALYRYGTVAYIGGGFGKGLHNILEAATFGLPLLFGPRYGQFREANDLIRLGGAFRVTTGKEIAGVVNGLLSDHARIGMASGICRQYVEEQSGATIIVAKKLKSLLKQ